MSAVCQIYCTAAAEGITVKLAQIEQGARAGGDQCRRGRKAEHAARPQPLEGQRATVCGLDITCDLHGWILGNRDGRTRTISGEATTKGRGTGACTGKESSPTCGCGKSRIDGKIMKIGEDIAPTIGDGRRAARTPNKSLVGGGCVAIAGDPDLTARRRTQCAGAGERVLIELTQGHNRAGAIRRQTRGGGEIERAANSHTLHCHGAPIRRLRPTRQIDSEFLGYSHGGTGAIGHDISAQRGGTGARAGEGDRPSAQGTHISADRQVVEIRKPIPSPVAGGQGAPTAPSQARCTDEGIAVAGNLEFAAVGGAQGGVGVEAVLVELAEDDRGTGPIGGERCRRTQRQGAANPGALERERPAVGRLQVAIHVDGLILVDRNRGSRPIRRHIAAQGGGPGIGPAEKHDAPALCGDCIVQVKIMQIVEMEITARRGGHGATRIPGEGRAGTGGIPVADDFDHPAIGGIHDRTAAKVISIKESERHQRPAPISRKRDRR